jgi:hypothetical protein
MIFRVKSPMLVAVEASATNTRVTRLARAGFGWRVRTP